jgi:hypothetical protein
MAATPVTERLLAQSGAGSEAYAAGLAALSAADKDTFKRAEDICNSCAPSCVIGPGFLGVAGTDTQRVQHSSCRGCGSCCGGTSDLRCTACRAGAALIHRECAAPGGPRCDRVSTVQHCCARLAIDHRHRHQRNG